MSSADHFVVKSGWSLILTDLGLSADSMLRRANLPGDLFSRKNATLSTSDYFRLWRGVEEEAGDPTLPITLGGAISVEAFDPPIFAALCSSDLNQALNRIARYKRLTCPMMLHVDTQSSTTSLEIEWADKTVEPPVMLLATELVFFVQLARLATRTEVQPLSVRTTRLPAAAEAYARYFGVAVEAGPAQAITFAAADAARPFLTANEPMWAFFEPELEKRLSQLDQSAAISQRVRAALLELLPAGSSSIQAVSAKLGVSTRTLQRRLQDEDSNFQLVLSKTREELANHYLRHSEMSGAEISFLLGFEDPNSFFRAFHAWTGATPQNARMAVRPSH